MNELLLAIGGAEIGTSEIAGKENNPRILHYTHTAGLDWYQSDGTSWCGVFMAFCLKQIPEFMRPNWPEEKAATARQWLSFGVYVPIAKAKPGDIVVFWRESRSSWKGHVAFFVRETPAEIVCLGGNQSNKVCEKSYPKSRLLGIRRY